MMEDIYRHRKAKAKVRLLQNGNPLVRKRVCFQQKSHEFRFGCGAFETMRVTEAESDEERAFYSQRMELWQEIFNFATLPFYWAQYEPRQGEIHAESIKKAAMWLKERGIELKGHPLCWHSLCADWLLNMDNREILRLQQERIKREVTQFKDLIDMWDVINEVVIMPEFDRYDNAITRICRSMGRAETVRRMFEAARESNPEALLLINDFNTSPQYERLIEECLDAGISIDAIGIQSHQHQGYWGKEKLMDVLERFSKFQLPIHFTENTFVSGHLMPPEIVDLNDYQISEWKSTPEGEIRQAENVEEFYRILFACPQVEAITTWAFQDGAWLGAPAGLVRTDNSKKPAFHTLHNLLKKEWMTVQETVTDDNGFACLEGFRGNYDVTVQEMKTEFSLCSNDEITVLLEK